MSGLSSSDQFGQIVIGPPGCGKTTYCQAMASLFTSLGRKVALVNLDPANDTVPYSSVISLTELVEMQEVMAAKGLGPNGALVQCMEILTKNTDWLLKRLKEYKDHYFVFDFPGQAELYTHHTMVRDLMQALDGAGIKLCSVYLMESHYTNEPGKYLSALLVALISMMQLESPAVNLLTKVDLVDKYEALQMPLEFYTEVLDLNYLLEQLDDSRLTKRYHKLNKMIAELVMDYSLVTFIPVAASNRHTLLNVMKAVDKANGYIYGSHEERNIQRLLSCAVGAEYDHDRLGVVKDQYQSGLGDASDDAADEEEEEELMRAYATQNPNMK